MQLFNVNPIQICFTKLFNRNLYTYVTPNTLDQFPSSSLHQSPIFSRRTCLRVCLLSISLFFRFTTAPFFAIKARCKSHTPARGFYEDQFNCWCRTDGCCFGWGWIFMGRWEGVYFIFFFLWKSFSRRWISLSFFIFFVSEFCIRTWVLLLNCQEKGDVVKFDFSQLEFFFIFNIGILANRPALWL